MLLTGVASLVIIEVYSAVMQKFFQHSDNDVGKGFSILGIYLVAAFYCRVLHTRKKIRAKLTIIRYRQPYQQHHLALRSRGFTNANSKPGYGCGCSLALYSQCRTYANSSLSSGASDLFVCLVTQAGPSAFATIHENYYYVFVGCCAVYFAIIYFYYPYARSQSVLSHGLLLTRARETNQKTLEEIAAQFGDKVLSTEETIANAELAKNSSSTHIERVESAA